MQVELIYVQKSDSWGPYYQYCFTLNLAWTSNDIHYKTWNEDTYPMMQPLKFGNG